MKANNTLFTIAISLITAALLTTTAPAARNGQMTAPDFTKGAKIPAGATHDWNLIAGALSSEGGGGERWPCTTTEVANGIHRRAFL